MIKIPIKCSTGLVAAVLPMIATWTNVQAAIPGGTLDPTTIPKYVTDLVIPGVMKQSADPNVDYQIAVRAFKQQMLPTQGCVDVDSGGTQPVGACKNNGSFKPTKVWGYGPASDVAPNVAPVPAAQSQFNNASFTIEATQNVPITVDWINDLVNQNNENYLRYQSLGLEVDATLHWANPGAACLDGIPRTDCAGDNAKRYRGPVPMVTHVHGAHTTPESDGYTEAWYLPAANNIECVEPALAQDGTRNNHTDFVCEGTLANGFDVAANTGGGKGTFTYPNDQPSTTLWYHDHSLGLTRLNVYAMGAGFWNIRTPGGGEDGLRNASQILPGPAPAMGEDPNFIAADRAKLREIPIAIQDKGFNNTTLFYPKNRAFFEGLGDGSRFDKNALDGLDIPFLPDAANSDISPIWNPEVFFNTNVVNGVVWPKLEVAAEQYRFRLLNGANGRFYNLEMYVVNPVTNEIDLTQEVPFYQIGAEQSLLPRVVKVTKGCKVQLRGDGIEPAPGTCPAGNAADFADEALLMGPAERADVIVNFTGLADDTLIRMINTGPDAPFGGFPFPGDESDPATSGQVMQFVVNSTLNNPDGDPSTEVDFLKLRRVEPAEWTAVRNASAGMVRDLALLEEESELICVFVDAVTGFITQDTTSVPPLCDAVAGSVPFGPKAAVLGIDGRRGGTAQLWDDPITQDPRVGSSERWQFWNWSADAHPIHIHLVKFRVLNRRTIGGASRPPTLTERGWKDTVIAYPGEMTQVAAKFDLPGLYVWHCHLLEHEDNEMMVPYCVTNADGSPGPGCTGLMDPMTMDPAIL